MYCVVISFYIQHMAWLLCPLYYVDKLFVSDRKRLREYLQSRYKDSRYCKVTPLPDWVGLTVRDIFSPVVLVRNSKDNQEILVSPNDPFYKKMTRQKRLGEARAGKTKFCKHLVDVWCNRHRNRQFDDADVLQ